MPRGQPDFGMYASKEVTASISDMGEVAARLGSIVTYDRRGDVVFFDNFEEPLLKWYASPPFTNQWARLDNENARSGSQAAKLWTQAAGEPAKLYRGFSLVKSKQIGFEISFGELNTNCDLYFHVQYYRKPTVAYAALKLNPLTGALYVYHRDDSWVEIGNVGYLLVSHCAFLSMKLVVDFVTNKYMRLLFSLDEYDISAIPLWVTGYQAAPYILVHPELRLRTGDEGEVWLDDFVLTQAEP